QRPGQVVHPEAGGVVRADDELALAGLRGLHQAAPARGESLRAELVRCGVRTAEIEPDFRIDPNQGAVATLLPGIEVIVAARPYGVEVIAAEAALPGAGCGFAEAAHQVRDRVPVLAHRQARKLDPGFLVPGPRDGRIEGVVEVAGHLLRLASHAGTGLV